MGILAELMNQLWYDSQQVAKDGVRCKQIEHVYFILAQLATVT